MLTKISQIEYPVAVLPTSRLITVTTMAGNGITLIVNAVLRRLF